jgi:hypothetical protein
MFGSVLSKILLAASIGPNAKGSVFAGAMIVIVLCALPALVYHDVKTKGVRSLIQFAYVVGAFVALWSVLMATR